MADHSLVQACVRMICGCLADLSPDDQARALEQASVALGLRVYVAQPDPGPLALTSVPASPDPVPPYQEPPDVSPRAPLPMVQIEMRGDRPMVVGRSIARSIARPRPSTVVLDAQGRLPLLATRGSDPSTAAEQDRPRGYVCRIR